MMALATRRVIGTWNTTRVLLSDCRMPSRCIRRTAARYSTVHHVVVRINQISLVNLHYGRLYFLRACCRAGAATMAAPRRAVNEPSTSLARCSVGELRWTMHRVHTTVCLQIVVNLRRKTGQVKCRGTPDHADVRWLNGVRLVKLAAFPITPEQGGVRQHRRDATRRLRPSKQPFPISHVLRDRPDRPCEGEEVHQSGICDVGCGMRKSPPFDRKVESIAMHAIISCGLQSGEDHPACSQSISLIGSEPGQGCPQREHSHSKGMRTSSPIVSPVSFSTQPAVPSWSSSTPLNGPPEVDRPWKLDRRS
jgi:hypothetical protein